MKRFRLDNLTTFLSPIFDPSEKHQKGVGFISISIKFWNFGNFYKICRQF